MSYILLATGLLLIGAAFLSDKLGKDAAAKFAELVKGCISYRAAVLGINKKASLPDEIILQFRIPEQKKTVVSKCTEPFYGKYSRGDEVELLFREEMPIDFSMLAEDNRYRRNERIFGKIKLPSGIAGAVMTAGGIILLILGV